MKKAMIIVLTIVVASSMVFAQGALPKKGDIFVGGKVGLGAFYGASLGFGGGVEYVVQEDFLNLGDIPASLGVGGSFGYSTYKAGWSYWNYKYTNYVIFASAFYHADVLKNEKLDTYVKFSLGYNGGKIKYDGPAGENYTNRSYNGTITTGSALGARYFFTPALAAVAEIGWGFGLLRLGLDLKL